MPWGNPAILSRGENTCSDLKSCHLETRNKHQPAGGPFDLYAGLTYLPQMEHPADVSEP